MHRKGRRLLTNVPFLADYADLDSIVDTLTHGFHTLQPPALLLPSADTHCLTV
jgi:hypothetical protein